MTQGCGAPDETTIVIPVACVPEKPDLPPALAPTAFGDWVLPFGVARRAGRASYRVASEPAVRRVASSPAMVVSTTKR